ncbi:alpha/beta fold hydrolase [Aromatoleum evansii]|uniref:Alpha/beta fold hydrolase n=1 Tax=Aromatoleum evansii TaxID=59406 RepID=A0ABZ1ATL1_AROEV|nr:alpha/beta fold hydrolase [Aromatoleum evansii]NMG30991.1 alpha/beta fold hydrolase [Aromatoleum evansii]WRL48184.1 alpha/beta fold hydrolase [Aromatoleum evansii]
MSALPLVLLHGWGLTPSVWRGLREALPSRAVTLAPALPGHGNALPAPSADLAAWSDALLPALPDRAALCGWSLGGLIALDLARRHPERVARLILIGSTPRFVARSDDGPWPHGLDAATVAAFNANFATDPAGTQKKFVALQSLGDARRRAVAGELAAALADTGPERAPSLSSGLEVLANTDLRAFIPEIRQPAQLIHGASDALMPLAAAEWLAQQLPDARLAIFDDCGHAPFLSRPDECAALIAGSLDD